MNRGHTIAFVDIVEVADDAVYQVRTRAPGPEGSLPLRKEQVVDAPSGDIFGYTLDAGMGWNPAELGRKEYLILSTLGTEDLLPDDTRLWAALQNVGGGTWGGCVYDVDAIVQTLKAGQEALAARGRSDRESA